MERRCEENLIRCEENLIHLLSILPCLVLLSV